MERLKARSHKKLGLGIALVGRLASPPRLARLYLYMKWNLLVTFEFDPIVNLDEETFTFVTFFDLCWDLLQLFLPNDEAVAFAEHVPTFLPTFLFFWSLMEDCPLPSCLVPGRCSGAGETYVDNDDEATCLLNSNGNGYDYSAYPSSKACPYEAGATEHLGQQNREEVTSKLGSRLDYVEEEQLCCLLVMILWLNGIQHWVCLFGRVRSVCCGCHEDWTSNAL